MVIADSVCAGHKQYMQAAGIRSLKQQERLLILDCIWHQHEKHKPSSAMHDLYELSFTHAWAFILKARLQACSPIAISIQFKKNCDCKYVRAAEAAGMTGQQAQYYQYYIGGRLATKHSEWTHHTCKKCCSRGQQVGEPVKRELSADLLRSQHTDAFCLFWCIMLTSADRLE